MESNGGRARKEKICRKFLGLLHRVLKIKSCLLLTASYHRLVPVYKISVLHQIPQSLSAGPGFHERRTLPGPGRTKGLQRLREPLCLQRLAAFKDEVFQAPVPLHHVKPPTDRANPRIGVAMLAFSSDNSFLATKNGDFKVTLFCWHPSGDSLILLSKDNFCLCYLEGEEATRQLDQKRS
ncbi:hypothetical protein E2320_006121 [Naja naja]|nr:hypothetical protein E2320_006121 [Naja naja]